MQRPCNLGGTSGVSGTDCRYYSGMSNGSIWIHASMDADGNAPGHDCTKEPATQLSAARSEVEESIEANIGRSFEHTVSIDDIEASHHGVEVDKECEAHTNRQRRQLRLELGDLLVVSKADPPSLIQEDGAHPLDVVAADL
mmetsp:Transcript_34128/g.98264  ORF Transcript_34128/g.98264 Transcript_34128/m.98264 type:complete len:141 (-) Transcript_34128:814-1236(-)